jgi:hypothetical protein
MDRTPCVPFSKVIRFTHAPAPPAYHLPPGTRLHGLMFGGGGAKSRFLIHVLGLSCDKCFLRCFVTAHACPNLCVITHARFDTRWKFTDVTVEADAAERMHSPQKAFAHVVFCAVDASMVVVLHFAGHHSAASPGTASSAMSHSASLRLPGLSTALWARPASHA